MTSSTPFRLSGLTALLLSGASAVSAMPGNLPAGAELVTRGSYTGFFNPSFSSNPAMLPVALGDRSYSLGGFSLPAFALEIGQVDNLAEQFDSMEEALDNAESSNSDGGENVTQDEADAIKAEFDAFVAELDENAYVAFDVALPLPALPVMFKALGGTIAVNAEASVGVNIQALGDELRYNQADEEIETDTSLYVRSGEFTRIGVSYGKEMGKFAIAGNDFDVNVGGRLTLTKASLSRQVIRIVDDSDDEDESAFDRAEENYDENKEDTTTLGLDVGFALHNSKSHFGATIRNLIPQEFDYADIGIDCGQKPTEGQQADCDAAANFEGRINLRDSYELEPQLALEASHTIHESGLRVFGGLEANSVENVAGHEYQWASIGLGYVGPWWLPGVQVAYHSNLAGEKLDMLSLGMQLFKAVNLQVSLSPETAEVDGDDIYRSAAVSLTFATSL
ncbi:conjugal transfer protein TraF [Spongiibacter sp. KMU-166]|uniref:Conjugal transfer protein TraF n=1 Tax=Spongiibacter thalassae TaxID=2721624 RepID=A0ABX1GJS5_9GAMM|nr:conjugal transfer protein TraF [Spongiibacter thalassae]NKI18414.1 conjugal transfer protein TraF [Spongiibacter thalassae]